MPVYEYECQECDKVFEVQQKIADPPIRFCPDCQAPVKKLVSKSSFQLKGSGWYADGYASSSAKPAEKVADVGAGNGADKAATPTPAPACPAGGSCAGCPAGAAAAAA